MEGLTVGQIIQTITLLGALFSALGIISHNVKKYSSGWLTSGLKPIEIKIDKLNEKISFVDMESCKNFLVRFLADVEQGNQIDEVEKQRFHEVWKHYSSIGGNSYIEDKIDKLKKAGKL